MNLAKLPSVIARNHFDENGLAKTSSGLLVPAYVGSQLGFNLPGRKFLEQDFYPDLEKIGILPLCPFKACGEYLDLSKLTQSTSIAEMEKFWQRFNETVGVVNYDTLMPNAKLMIALFDGGHAVDDGLASEVAYFASKLERPIIGIRSDIRLAENPAAPINPAVRYFIDKGHSKSRFFDGHAAYGDAMTYMRELAQSMIEGK